MFFHSKDLPFHDRTTITVENSLNWHSDRLYEIHFWTLKQLEASLWGCLCPGENCPDTFSIRKVYKHNQWLKINCYQEKHEKMNWGWPKEDYFHDLTGLLYPWITAHPLFFFFLHIFHPTRSVHCWIHKLVFHGWSVSCKVCIQNYVLIYHQTISHNEMARCGLHYYPHASLTFTLVI